jgi:hypothetical protein
MKIAYIASQVTLPGSPVRRSDAFEHDYMMRSLVPAFAEKGMTVVDVAWDDANVDWSSFGAAIIGTTWDYWDRIDEFLDTLDSIGKCTRLFNSADMVRWNSRKTYLKDLESKGARLIPTLWMDEVTPDEASSAFDALGANDLVFKRQIGAGARDQFRLKRGEAIPSVAHPMMVQPFLDMIQTEGEISFIFIDGQFSHALIKRAANGDYRIQSEYGGREEPIKPSADDLAAAQAIIGSLDETPLYGRVDMLRGQDGQLLLMELELIEPYLYPIEGPELGNRLAAAVAQQLEITS